MAWRVEIGENVENATGLNVTGATVVVKYHGGAQAPVYDAENGGSLLTQPLATVNGKIGADAPSGAWVAEGDYDLEATFGGVTLVFFWPARRGDQFVTTLPAGAGTSAPEDGEKAIELYDATNGGAWLRRYRAAATAWDMVGGPPPAATSLPGSPRVRQEIYLTGGSPAIRHQRYNGATWDYVGTPPTVPVTGSPLTIAEPGQASQVRAGRNFAVADFTTLAALPTTPVGLFPLSGTTNNGSGGALVNKGTVTFGTGILGTTHAAVFQGLVTQALYILDTGAADPFRIKTGSFGCWFRTAKTGTQQMLVTKWAGAGTRVFQLYVSTANVLAADISADGTATVSTATGTTYVADDRWHFVAVVFDGTQLRLYVDGAPETTVIAPGLLFAGAAPFNIGGAAADAGTNATLPMFGRIDEAFVTPDVLSAAQHRLLYASSIPHGYGSLPTRAHAAVRRRQRGGAYATTDFPAQPIRLHNFTAGVLTDQGSGNVTLTSNPGTGAITACAAPDGTKDGAFSFSGAHNGLSSTDTGLPATTTSRTYGCWLKTATIINSGVMGWGTIGTNDAQINVAVTTGALRSFSGADTITGPNINDGLWHFVVVVEDNAPADGVKRKLYLDGRFVGGSTVLTSLTLAGANKFRVGAAPDGTLPFVGQVDGAFIASTAYTLEQILAVYHKGFLELTTSPTGAEELIEGFDATNVYAVLDSLDSVHRIDLSVAA